MSIVGVQGFEVCDEIGAVENALAEVPGERSQPGPAQQTTEIAHRVLAVHTGPIGERRSRKHDRSDDIGVSRAHHHDLPAGLAITYQARLALGVRMSSHDLFNKPSFCLANGFDCLTGHRIGQKTDEIAGMTCRKRDADLAVVLHASDPRAVAGARVENDKRSLVPFDRGPFGRDDAHQRVVDGARQRAPVEHQLDVEAEHVRRLARIMLEIIVAALTQYIEQQNRALPRIDPILDSTALFAAKNGHGENAAADLFEPCPDRCCIIAS